MYTFVCNNDEVGFCQPCQNDEGGFVNLVKMMRLLLSTLSK